MLFEHAKEALAAHILLPILLETQPDPSAMPSPGSSELVTAHGPLALRVMAHLRGVVGMGPLDIILLLPTIIQLIQTLVGDFEAIVKFIQNLKKPTSADTLAVPDAQ